MERRLAVHAGSHRQALILAIVLAGGPAVAAPSGTDAKQQFDRGVAAYTKGDYQVANDAFSRSYGLEQDAETAFAWAQTERKLDRCDKAIELYDKLLTMDLPAENKTAITEQRTQCKDIVAAQKPVEPVRDEPKPVEKPAEPPVVEQPPQPPAPEGRAWWRDPVGDGLVGVGVVGLGIGAALLVSAHTADQDSHHAMTYLDAQSLSDTAKSRGQLGVISVGVGAACVIGGIAWYATHGKHDATTVTGWLAPAGGGVGIAGGF